MKKIVENTLNDMESMRLRLEKEKEQTKVFAITKFAGEVLEVNDNIIRALQANKDLPDKETNTLYEGMHALTYTLLLLAYSQLLSLLGTLMTQKVLDQIL